MPPIRCWVVTAETGPYLVERRATLRWDRDYLMVGLPTISGVGLVYKRRGHVMEVAHSDRPNFFIALENE